MRSPPPRRPPNPAAVERWSGRFAAAELVVVLDPTGVPTPTITALRKQLRPFGPSVGVVMLRNSTAEAIIADSPLDGPLRSVLKGPCLFVVAADVPYDLVMCLHRQLIGGELRWRTRRPDRRTRSLRVRRICWRGAVIRPAELRDVLAPPPPSAVVAAARTLPARTPDADAWVVPASALEALRQALAPALNLGSTLAPRASSGLDGLVRLEATGPNWMQVLRAVRPYRRETLAALKALIQNPPVLVDTPDSAQAEALVAELRAHGARALRMAEPPRPSGWRAVHVDQAAILAATPHLSLMPGWRLHGTAYASSSGGNGVIFALPDGAAPLSIDAGFPLRPGMPAGGRPVETYLQGDDSPEAYLEASILRRELAEFAAWWHGVSWWAHRFVDVLPERDWTWVEFHADDAPAPLTLTPAHDLRPRVETAGPNEVVVTFFTISALGTIRLVCHRDRYRRGRYAPVEAIRLICATGGMGYVV